MNRWYFGRDGAAPDYDDRDEPRCGECHEHLWGSRQIARGTCDECHSANDESERWIDRHERHHATGTDD